MLNPAEPSLSALRQQQAERYIADYQRLQAQATPWQGLAAPNAALLCVWLLLLAFGFVMQVSVQLHESALEQILKSLAVYGFVSLFLAAFVAYRTPMRNYVAWIPWFLLLTVIASLLLFVPGLGKKVNGAYRWLDFKIVTLQVSEVMKWVMVVFSAHYLTKRLPEIPSHSWRSLFKLSVWYGLMFILLYLQSDLGTVVILIAMLWAMTLLAGANFLRYSLGLVLLGGLLIAGFVLSSDYRIKRFMSFLSESKDRAGSDYQVMTALESHGLGGESGFFGRGLGHGTYKYLTPEIENDFIFANIGEEMGLFGLLVVMFLFVVLIGLMMRIGWRAYRQRAYFEAFYCYGVAIWFGMQSWFHMAVNTGLVPAKGLTLPFVSAGGSSLVVSCFAVAMVLRADSEVRGRMQHEAQIRALSAST